MSQQNFLLSFTTMAEYWKRGVGLPSTVQSPCGEVLSGLQVVSRLDKDNLSSASPDMAGEAEGVPQSPRTSQREIWSTRERFKAGSPGAVSGSTDGIVGRAGGRDGTGGNPLLVWSWEAA